MKFSSRRVVARLSVLYAHFKRTTLTCRRNTRRFRTEPISPANQVKEGIIYDVPCFAPPQKIEHLYPRKHSTTSTPSKIFLNIKASIPLLMISPAIYLSSSQPIEWQRHVTGQLHHQRSCDKGQLSTTTENFLIMVIGRPRDKRIFLRLRLGLLEHLKINPVHAHRPIMARMINKTPGRFHNSSCATDNYRDASIQRNFSLLTL